MFGNIYLIGMLPSKKERNIWMYIQILGDFMSSHREARVRCKQGLDLRWKKANKIRMHIQIFGWYHIRLRKKYLDANPNQGTILKHAAKQPLALNQASKQDIMCSVGMLASKIRMHIRIFWGQPLHELSQVSKVWT